MTPPKDHVRCAAKWYLSNTQSQLTKMLGQYMYMFGIFPCPPRTLRARTTRGPICACDSGFPLRENHLTPVTAKLCTVQRSTAPHASDAIPIPGDSLTPAAVDSVQCTRRSMAPQFPTRSPFHYRMFWENPTRSGAHASHMRGDPNPRSHSLRHPVLPLFQIIVRSR